MPTLSDAPFDDPLLNDAFDFSRYPTFKTRNTKPSNELYELRHRVRGRITLFTCGSPPAPCPRNVSEPQLVSSTNYMRESWFTNLASARSVGDIAHLSSDDDTAQDVPCSQSTAMICETPSNSSWCDADDEKTTSTAGCEDPGDVSAAVERSEYDEDHSFYSMDSADQDVHPLLLSMPIIPQIKLERKATVRTPDHWPSSDAAQSRFFLSPRIADLRTPARMSSRRYGRILRTSPPVVTPDGSLASENIGHGALSPGASQRSGTQMGCVRSISEPTLKIAYRSDDEEEPLEKKEGTDGLPLSDVLLPTTSDTDFAFPRRRQLPLTRSSRGHRRSFMSHSISFSRIVSAVADRCVSLDFHFRKKPKPKPIGRPNPREHAPNAHDPTSKWAPKQGQIVIKVFVPATDDIWMFRVPQDISLAAFTSMVAKKLGISVAFSGSVWDDSRYYFGTDKRFKMWVKGRIRFGRNLPLVAHVLPPLPLVRLGVSDDGCEVWCYA